MANAERATLGTHNVVGSFVGASKARRAADALRAAGVPEDEIVVAAESDHAESMKAEMREEMDHSAAGGAISVINPEMARGAAKWAVLGGAIGLVVGTFLGLAFFSTTGTLIAAIAFALGGSVAGFVAGGFTEPRSTEDARDRHSEARVTVGVHSQRVEHVKKADSLFEETGADRIDRFDAEGNPVPELSDKS